VSLPKFNGVDFDSIFPGQLADPRGADSDLTYDNDGGIFGDMKLYPRVRLAALSSSAWATPVNCLRALDVDARPFVLPFTNDRYCVITNRGRLAVLTAKNVGYDGVIFQVTVIAKTSK
jgi:hypothetical protein